MVSKLQLLCIDSPYVVVTLHTHTHTHIAQPFSVVHIVQYKILLFFNKWFPIVLCTVSYCMLNMIFYVSEGVHFIIYISVGVCSLLFLLVLFLVAIIFCWHRAKLRRQMRRLMSDNSNSFSYNSTLSYEQSLRHSQRYSSFG